MSQLKVNAEVSFGSVPWTYESMRSRLDEFAHLYDQRPIQDNTGGMKFPHMFITWFALSMLNPKVIIESGVFKGQGTWLFEQACPQAELYCIDINLQNIRYRSQRAEYFDKDFATLDWSHLPVEETVCFFDDHQNAYERVKVARWFGFKHLLFEDNYPPAQGDCYTLKKAFMGGGFRKSVSRAVDNPALIGRLMRSLHLRKRPPRLKSQVVWDVEPNSVDAYYLRQNLDAYYEFPPIFHCERTRWGDLWDDLNYPTPPALLDSTATYEHLHPEEATYYTWLCYARLR